MQMNRERPEWPALVCGESTVTYGHLWGRVHSKAQRLASLGCRGRKLALDLPDSFTLIEWVQAGWLEGCCLLVLDPRLTAPEKEDRLQCFQPDWIVAADDAANGAGLGIFRPDVAHRLESGQDRLNRLLQPARRGCLSQSGRGDEPSDCRSQSDRSDRSEQSEPSNRSEQTEPSNRSEPPEQLNEPERLGLATWLQQTEAVEIKAGETAMVLFSSGSTALPKQIARTFSSLRSELNQYALEPGAPDASSRVLCLVPVSHSFGLISSVVHTLIRGGTVLFPETPKPRAIVETIIHQQATHVFGVAFHYRQMAGEWIKHNRQWHPSLCLLSSGGPISEDLLAQMSGLQLPVGQQYGMSEVGYIAVQWDGLPQGAVGRPAGHLDVALTAEQELVIALDRSPYEDGGGEWRAPSSPGGKGRLHTQDIVSVDGEGYLSIVRRKNDQVSIGGLKVTLSEIEQTLKSHPHVRDCCAVSVELPAAGTVIEAFVVWNDNGEYPTAAMKEWLGGRMARYKIPRGIHSVRDIPVSPAGKIMKGALLKECAYGIY